MESSLYELSYDILSSLNYVLPENTIERMCSSIGCHIINLVNLREKRVFQGMVLANYRQHLVLMAPSGYFKTSMLNAFLNKRYGLLSKSSIVTNIAATFSKESWAGTIDKNDMGNVVVAGVFEECKQGILGADDYMKLKELMDGYGMENDEVYLMTALESDSMEKRLALGKIMVDDIGMTFWVGIRPTILSRHSGLARRFMYQLFYPTPTIAKEFKEKSRRMTRGIDAGVREDVARKIQQLYDSNMEFSTPDFSKIDYWVDTHMNVPHFEDKIYRRIALGYSVATDIFPEITVDDRLKSLLESEYEARKNIALDPLPQIIRKCLEEVEQAEVSSLVDFIDKHYQYSLADIDCAIKRMMFGREVVQDGRFVMLSEKRHEPEVKFVLEVEPKRRKKMRRRFKFR